jgi:hypothetical protein
LEALRKVVGLARAGLQNWAIIVYLKELGFDRKTGGTDVLSSVVYSPEFFLVKIFYL